MRRSVYFSSLAALLAGTAAAGPHGMPAPRAAGPSCCAEGAAAALTAGAVAAPASEAARGVAHAGDAVTPFANATSTPAAGSARMDVRESAPQDAP